MMLLALVLQVSSTPSSPSPPNGARLYDACKAMIRNSELPGGVMPGWNDLVGSRECTSYIGGFLDALKLSGDTYICVKQASIGTIGRVYIQYLDNHPKLRDEPQAIALVDSLLEAYPCKK